MKNIENQLKKIGQKIQKGTSGKVTFAELFNNEFMVKYSEFTSIEEMFEYCKLDIKTQEDYNNIDESMLDECVKEKTKFNDWKEMLQVASKEEMVRRLNKLGIKTE